MRMRETVTTQEGVVIGGVCDVTWADQRIVDAVHTLGVRAVVIEYVNGGTIKLERAEED